MEKKLLNVVPLGMQKDVSVVQADQQHAFDMKNIRITTTGNNTQLCLQNERSNKKVDSITLNSTVLGCQELSDYTILFLKGEKDYIIKVYLEDNNLTVHTFYSGELSFNLNNPIETVGIYESDNVQKVYWVDGINSPRLINVANNIIYDSNNPSQFDFLPTLNNDKPLKLEVSPIFNTNANFPGGVIQYAVSYFNKFRQQSPIIYQSPLYYTSDNGRGLNPDGAQKTSTSFKLTISNISADWEYIRVYRILRTTLDDTPSVEYIGDYPSDSFYESSKFSTLTSNSFTKIKYGKEGTYTGTGSLRDMMEDFTEKVREDLEYPNIVLINSVGIHNQNPDTNKDFYIQASSGTDTIQLLIPKDKIVRLQWEKTEDKFDLTKKYFISIGDEEDPFNYSSEEYISILRDGVEAYDTGTTGTSVDPSELLFLGGTDLIASTMEHKDGTLFLGNITDNKATITKEVKEKIKSKSTLKFVLSEDNPNTTVEDIANTLNTQWIFNSNLLKSSNESTHFQCGEVYRFGVQFLSNKGTWSEVVYLGDLENDKRIVPYNYNDGIKNKPILNANIYLPEEVKSHYIAAKLVCVYPTIQDRNILCQGIVCPTVFNIADRDENGPYAQSSWFARPNITRNNSTTAKGSKSTGLGSKEFEYDLGINTTTFNIKTTLEAYDRGTTLKSSSLFELNDTSYSPESYLDVSTEYLKNHLNFKGQDDAYGNYIPQDWIIKNGLFEKVGEEDTIWYEATIVDDGDQDFILLDANKNGILDKPFNNYKLYQAITLPAGNYRLDFSCFMPGGVYRKQEMYLIVSNKDSFSLEDSMYYKKIEYSGCEIHFSLDKEQQVFIGGIFTLNLYTRLEIFYFKLLKQPKTYNVDCYVDCSLPSSRYYNAEIQCLKNNIRLNRDDSYNAFGIEDRIITLHSPELDDSYSEELINNSLKGVKFKVTGYAPVKNNFSDINIQVENPATNISDIYNKKPLDISMATQDNNYISGFSYINRSCWVDRVMLAEDGNEGVFDYNSYIAAFPIYPWHRKGSLSNQGRISKEENKKSILKTKTLSNLRVCLPSRFLNVSYNMGISNVEIWGNYNTTNDIKVLKTSELWNIKTDIIYKGDIDALLTFENEREIEEGISYVPGRKYNDIKPSKEDTYNTASFEYGFLSLNGSFFTKDSTSTTVPLINSYNTEPIPMQYKSTGHAVFALSSYTELDGNLFYTVLPRIYTSDHLISKHNSYTFTREKYYYQQFDDSKYLDKRFLLEEERHYSGVYSKLIQVEDNILLKQAYELGGDTDDIMNASCYFLIGELYRDNVLNRFGGTSEQALASNIWTTCGDIVYFNDTSNITLIGDQGDTYYCRYDHLKTQPLGEGKVNNIVDIVSFMCETRINIDGRYDRNRGLESNLHITSNNFNLFNKVYSQRNNFFTGSYLRADDLFNTKFPSQVMWSKTKVNGEDIDSWTTIIPTSVLDLDGDKGDLVSLKRYGNEIFAFQEEGISKILYNNRVQINASDGIPIEIANSGKVEGKVYLPYIYGCQNKWSIVEATGGLYFIDNYNSSILHMSPEGSLTDISTTKGMSSWIKEFKDIDDYSWKPGNFNSIRSLYDSNTKDIYFTTKDTALAFNEIIGKFTSFYSYDNVSNLFNIKGKTYQIRDKEIWELQGGEDYNKFFSKTPSDYSIEIIANSEFSTDKIFDSIEFRTNDIATINYGKAKENEYPFKELVAKNEYQLAISTIDKLKKKFRTWRWQVGRDGRDRIRNPWAKFTLKGNNTNELKLYDINVAYYT